MDRLLPLRLLLAVADVSVVFVLNAVTFLWSAVLVAGLRPPDRGNGPPQDHEGTAGSVPARNAPHEGTLGQGAAVPEHVAAPQVHGQAGEQRAAGVRVDEPPLPEVAEVLVGDIATKLPPGSVPFQPWAKELYEQRRANNAKDDPTASCIVGGVPRSDFVPYPLKILEQTGQVTILYEAIHSFRQIFTDGRALPKDPSQRIQYGATVGGPIRQNRTHFFATYERDDRDTASVSTYTLPSADCATSGPTTPARRFGLTPTVSAAFGCSPTARTRRPQRVWKSRNHSSGTLR